MDIRIISHMSSLFMSEHKLATPKMPALPSADGIHIHRKMPLASGPHSLCRVQYRGNLFRRGCGMLEGAEQQSHRV